MDFAFVGIRKTLGCDGTGVKVPPPRVASTRAARSGSDTCSTTEDFAVRCCAVQRVLTGSEWLQRDVGRTVVNRVKFPAVSNMDSFLKDKICVPLVLTQLGTFTLSFSKLVLL